jgi:hypothetical protein
MPLGFHSLSHGIMPFGFFNIASDLLILNDHFAFASEVCGWFASWTTQVGNNAVFSEEVPMWVIDDRGAIGDLGGAIRGSDHRGLIGRSYELFPFPVRRADFKQDPEGHCTRSAMEALLAECAGEPRRIPVSVSSTVCMGPYEFDSDGFAELVLYLWRGGMPGWRDDIRPPYVIDMIHRIRASSAPAYQNQDWTP